MTLALELARFLTGISFNDMPPVAIERAKMVVASTLASAAIGQGLGSASTIRRLVKQHRGSDDATLWFDGTRVALADAIRVNTMLSSAAASDDSDLRSITHLGNICAPAALGAAEYAAESGREALAAVVAGYELSGRLTDAVNPGARGFHSTVAAGFAGAMVCSRLLVLSVEQTAHAIALVASAAGGLAMSTNTTGREYVAGLSSLAGVNAALAAKEGYQADLAILEAPGGFLQTFGGDGDPAPIVLDIGQEWDIVTDLAIKLMPGAHPYHSITEAAILAAERGDVEPEEVAQILVSTQAFPGLVSKTHPTNLAEAIHSLPFFMATAVAYRDFSWHRVTEAGIGDKVVSRLLDLVQLDTTTPDETLTWRWSGRVTLVLKDGRRYAVSVDSPRGSGPRGIEWADVDAKFRALSRSAGIIETRGEQILSAIHDFDQLEDMSRFAALLRTP